MRRLVGILSALGVLGGCVSAPSRGSGQSDERINRLLGDERANPSEVITAELAFARTAQEKGQWAAFREYATGDAVMFVPERVAAQDWLKKQSEPLEAVRWQPSEVWLSCDGSYGVTKGPWQRPGGSVGYFTTIWERQRNGTYKWILDQGDSLTEPLPVAEMISAQVADCPTERNDRALRDSALADFEANLDASGFGEADGSVAGSGEARDGTLVWHYAVSPGGARRLVVGMLKDGKFAQVLNSQVAADR